MAVMARKDALSAWICDVRSSRGERGQSFALPAGGSVQGLDRVSILVMSQRRIVLEAQCATDHMG